MAFITENTATGDGTTTDFSFTFPYLEETDIRVTVEASAAGSDPVEQTKDTDWTLANATTISFTSAPANLSTVRIFRDTNLDDAVVTYFAGSAIRAEDLNENQLQVLYSAQEVEDNAILLTGGDMTGDLKFNDANIVFEGATADDHETTLTVVDPTADQTYRLPNLPAGTYDVITTGDTNTVTGTMIADDTVGPDNLAHTAVTAGSYTTADITVDAQGRITAASSGTIDAPELIDDSVTDAKLADHPSDDSQRAVGSDHIKTDAITLEKMADNSVDSDQYVDGSIDEIHIGDNQVTFDKFQDIAANSIVGNNTGSTTGATALSASDVRTLINVENNANNYTHPNHTGDVTSTGDGATVITEDAVDSVKLQDHSSDDTKRAVTTTHIRDNAVTDAKLSDSSTTDADRAVGTNHIKDSAVTSAKILDGAIVDGDINASAAIAGSKISMSLNQLSDVNVGTPGSSQDNQVLAWDNANSEFSLTAASGGGGLGDIVDDGTPQLGGDLDVNGNSIVSVSNGDINITPNGTGEIVLDGLKWPQADGSSGQALTTDASGQLSFTTVTTATPDIDAVLQAGNQSNTDMTFKISGGNATIDFDASTGAAVFNQDGRDDGDFRVESDGNQHMLFVDASADGVGIGTSAPAAALDVTGDLILRDGNGTNHQIQAAGNTSFNEQGLDIDFRIEGDADENLLFVDAGNNRVGIGTNSPSQKFSVSGQIHSSNDIVAEGQDVTITAKGSDGNPGHFVIQEGAHVMTQTIPDVMANSYTVVYPDGPGATDQVLTITGAVNSNVCNLAWADQSASGGATGGGSDQVFHENSTTVTTDYTVGTTLGDTAACNAMSAGPITVNSGVTVTVNSGSRWVIV